MILTVTINAAVDRVYRVDHFALDRVHRTADWRVYAGGKGLNVARVYCTLGGKPMATGLLGGGNGRFIECSAREEGIDAQFVHIAQESRVCIQIVDHAAGTQTEVNEIGPTVAPAEVAELRRLVRELLHDRRFEILVLSGSICPGVPDTVYAELIEDARAAGVRSVLDASGEPLRMGFRARPWLVKPNRYELTMLVGREPRGEAETLDAAQSLVGNEVETVCVTLGSDGCLAATSEGAWRAVPPRVDFVSAVGSGDSFLAGYLFAVGRGESTEEALRLATGAGAANAEVYGSGHCTAERIRELAAQAEVSGIA